MAEILQTNYMGSIVLVSVLMICSAPSIQTDYRIQYAGAYNVSPDGTEAFALRSDGTATWVYGWKEGGQVKTTKKKWDLVCN